MRNSAAAQTPPPASSTATYGSGAAYVAPAASSAMYGSGAAYVAPAASSAMYGSGAAYVAPASSAPGGGYTYPAPASSGGTSAGYAKIPTYPAPPSAYPNPNPPPTPTQVSTTHAAAVQDPTAPPSPLAKAGELVTRLREQGQALIAARRPWAEVFRAPAFSKPPSVGEALARMRRNTAYFRANYALAVLAVVAASLLWHPGTLFVLLFLCAAWFFLYFARPAQGGSRSGSWGWSSTTAPCSPRSAGSPSSPCSSPALAGTSWDPS
ncbi:unnamed protein product [Miscanthus lutarioriparius]|uniref:PRA1 family protein n=1 Tax=Miscanthus lutarioriparius TaxID=422564 RepID=A0A811MK56_9POAL|nr:unnamed protein product [Miscanthus lutarioriparius]